MMRSRNPDDPECDRGHLVTAEGSRISHTVTFDPNGGTLEEGEESKEFFRE